MTRRYATNIILAASDQPFSLQTPQQAAVPCYAAICSSRVLRCVDATDTPFLSLNLDPGCADARQIQAKLNGHDIRFIDREIFSTVAEDFDAILHGEMSCAQARLASRKIVTILTGATIPSDLLDERIQKIADYLRDSRPSDIDLKYVANLIDLSPSRLMSLFAQQMGLPMSQFLLWTKMRHAVTLLQSDYSITEVAQASGFSDSAHLTRTFRQFYGIKPSVLANSNYVQLMVC